MKIRNLVLATSLLAGTAFSEVMNAIDVDFMIGRRWAEMQESGIQGNEYALSSHYKLMDLPVAVGGLFSLLDLRNEDLEGQGVTFDTAYGTELSFEVKAWLPKNITKSETFTPYAKFAQVILSDYETKGERTGDPIVGGNSKMTSKTEGETTGYQFNLGANFKYNDKVNFLAEYSNASKSMKTKTRVSGTQTVAGRSNTYSAKSSFDSRALLFGAQVQI